MKYYLGLDQGGTTTKAALYTSRGEEVAVAGFTTALLTPKPGYVEHDMDDLWQAVCKVIREVVQIAKISAGDVTGVGICGHGKGLYLWGKDDKPARPGIVSTDHRAYAYPLQWEKDKTLEKAFKLTCQHILACQPVSLLSWMRDDEPKTYANIRWVFECKDYIRFRLTGKAMAEVTDYSGTSLMNLHTRQFDPALLRLFKLDDIKDALPPLCYSTDVAGYVSEAAAELCGLRPGTPVAGGMFDINACAVAANVLDEENICMIAGTWSINEYLSKAPVLDGTVLMNSLFCLPEYYLIEESSPTSAGNLEWFVSQLLPEISAAASVAGQSVYDEINAWVESISPSEFIPIFLPFLLGSNVHPNAGGTFIGLNVSHSRRHMLRSVYEGIVFSHQYHLDKLLATRKAPPHCIRLAGGAARSRVWAQMFADILGFTVETVPVHETGALGAAMAAAVAVGQYKTLSEAAACMCPAGDQFKPNSAFTKIYKTRYSLYKKATECLNPLWSDLQDSIENS